LHIVGPDKGSDISLSPQSFHSDEVGTEYEGEGTYFISDHRLGTDIESTDSPLKNKSKHELATALSRELSETSSAANEPVNPPFAQSKRCFRGVEGCR
jgi:hypothetical protein